MQNYACLYVLGLGDYLVDWSDWFPSKIGGVINKKNAGMAYCVLHVDEHLCEYTQNISTIVLNILRVRWWCCGSNELCVLCYDMFFFQ